MLIPIQHEDMSARRWPVVTLGLIFVNVVVFLATHTVADKQESQLWEIRHHILILASRNPQLVFPAHVQQIVDYCKSDNPDLWAELQDSKSAPVDEWDAHIRQIDDPTVLQAEMDSLTSQDSQLASTSITEQYGFVPVHPRPVAYFTAAFLHGGWLHLLGNMWFLWLAGFVLEDKWGRPLFLVVYIAAGAMAWQFHAWANPGSVFAAVGASGAIAGLMGAFLVRFPKMKIRMTWFFDLGLLPFYRFWMRAYWLLPLWVLMEINDGILGSDGVAHWAHVGGFLFGGVAALALRYSGLERTVNRGIEDKVAWTPAAQVTEANALMENDRLDEAVSILKDHLATTPESFEAWSLLRSVYWRKSDVPAYREVAIKLCEMHLKAGEDDVAWTDYEEFLTLGGERMPPSIWLDLCRVAERGSLERAVSEYEKLAAAHPSERQSILALLAAARICLKRLNRPEDALRFFQAASGSSVPHLDRDQEIEGGIREAAAYRHPEQGNYDPIAIRAWAGPRRGSKGRLAADSGDSQS